MRMRVVRELAPRLRLVLAHGGDEPPVVFIEQVGSSLDARVVDLELRDAEVLMHAIADAITIARLDEGAAIARRLERAG